MTKHELIELWGAAIAGTVLVALPAAIWAFRGSLSWMDTIVALIGIASLVLAVEGFLRRRQRLRALRTARSRARHMVCPRSGELLVEDA